MPFNRKKRRFIKLNAWKIIPAAIAGVRAAIEAIEEAQEPESDAGEVITSEEAGDIAEAIGKAVANEVFGAILGKVA